MRDVFGSGAKFVVYKPVTVERAESSLRAARSLMKREKRGKLRISLHAPASIAYADAENVAATLLDLSEDGLHPNAKGYAVMAPLADQAIQTSLQHKT